MAEVQRVLGGRYLLKDKVGNGGMASVYRSTRPGAQPHGGSQDHAAPIRWRCHVRGALQAGGSGCGRTAEPYIVGVYDWGKDGDTYYIVMEYLRGTDLKSGVRSHGALTPRSRPNWLPNLRGTLRRP